MIRRSCRIATRIKELVAQDSSTMTVALKDFSWERMVAAVDAVRERAHRAADVLSKAGIPYIVINDPIRG